MILQCYYYPGNIMQTGITCKKIPAREFLYKSLLNSAWLRSRVRLAINKKQKYFSLQDHQLDESLIFFYFLRKDKKEIIDNSISL